MFLTVHSALVLWPPEREHFLVLIEMALETETTTGPFIPPSPDLVPQLLRAVGPAPWPTRHRGRLSKVTLQTDCLLAMRVFNLDKKS